MEDNTLLGISFLVLQRQQGLERLSFEMRGKHILENGKGWEAATESQVTSRGLCVHVCT